MTPHIHFHPLSLLTPNTPSTGRSLCMRLALEEPWTASSLMPPSALITPAIKRLAISITAWATYGLTAPTMNAHIAFSSTQVTLSVVVTATLLLHPPPPHPSMNQSLSDTLLAPYTWFPPMFIPPEVIGALIPITRGPALQTESLLMTLTLMTMYGDLMGIPISRAPHLTGTSSSLHILSFSSVSRLVRG